MNTQNTARKASYKHNLDIVTSVAIAYYQVLSKINDSIEPRSLLKRVKERKVIPVIPNAYIYFIAMVEKAFLNLDRLSQELVDEVFVNKDKHSNYRCTYSPSTYYRLKGKAFESFIDNLGLGA